MSLEDNVYKEYYSWFEQDRLASRKLSHTMLSIGKYMKYVTLTGIPVAMYLEQSMPDDIGVAGTIFCYTGEVAAGALSIHFSAAEVIFSAMYKKNNRDILTEQEIVTTRKAGSIGRCAHTTAAVAASIGLGAIVTESPIMLVFLPWFFLAPSILKMYKSLYTAAVDYTTEYIPK